MIDKPISHFEIFVDGEILSGEHFTSESATFTTEYFDFADATYVQILPNFLENLEAGFYSLVILFEDGSIVEEYIHILEEYYLVDDMDFQIVEIWIGGVLVFSMEYGQLVDEEFFDNIADGTPYTIVFEDGQIWEGEFFGWEYE